ncbi:AraC family transcriptional regulator [Pseudobutyrivibrio xylanivorans]|uniref:AraC-type DNA-binding protein n=1 Tax=Pseudobutyrivibrio xylanivorans DSM 14809 TaxID=1123012 RepID=A0A1M6I0F0_PSEXY|nr:AraC family transcriptional regulator [Pseudobutyrivibrio xylanivorans]SHJ27744.1 AraC-type DNA-binding protein [Pseudobutyrivibrio xylanivorans DSM 14809]
MININEYQAIHENVSHFDYNIAYNTYPCTIPLDFESVPLHWHEDVEFIYIKKGSGVIVIDGDEHTVNSGDIAFIIPGIVHGIFQNKDDSMEYENILFDGKIFSSSMDDFYDTFLLPFFENAVQVPKIFKQGVPGYESVRKYLDSNDNISGHREGAWGLAIKGNLYLMLFDLVTLYEEKRDASSIRRIDKLKPVIKYVELHYSEQMTVAEMADRAGFSESHFMRFFKDTFGVSFITYLNDYRLSMAARLLLSTEDNILDISQQVGFENLSHFNRKFKEKYNKTPKEYRINK